MALVSIIPVVYELEDQGRGELEASGTIHWYCSDDCRDRLPLTAFLVHGDEPMAEAEDDLRCEMCDGPIVPKIRAGVRIQVKGNVPVWGGERGVVTDAPVSHPDMDFIARLDHVGEVAFRVDEVEAR